MTKKTTRKKAAKKKAVTTLTHDEASRTNIPTAEFQSVVAKEVQKPVPVSYERGVGGLDEEKQNRNRDLDPQLIWRGKDEKDWSDLVTQAPPLFIQEKVHPKVLIDDLLRRTQEGQRQQEEGAAPLLFQDLYADFNGLPDDARSTEFYQHDANWTNRMILGDSLQVMASLAEREGLRGQVQCIYIDPPYGIKFNSNFQWSTTSRDVKDGKAEHITREPEQVKAFRDTWRDGIHSYLTYLRDRMTVARDLLHETGSLFVQIGDENVHRVRAVMDEVFGEGHFVAFINYATTGGFETRGLSRVGDHILWYCKSSEQFKFRPIFREKGQDTFEKGGYRRVEADTPNSDLRLFRYDNTIGQGAASSPQPFKFQGKTLLPARSTHWKAQYPQGMDRLALANRLHARPNSLAYIRFNDDFPVMTHSSVWLDTSVAGTTDGKIYVVQTNPKVIRTMSTHGHRPG